MVMVFIHVVARPDESNDNICNIPAFTSCGFDQTLYNFFK